MSQFSTETFAEEYVEIALRSGIEDHQEFTEFVEMLKESIVIGDLDVSVGIVGEECRKGNGRHNADQISGDDDHQHVGDIVAFLFVGIDATMSSFAVRQRMDQMKIQFQDDQKWNDTHEKTIHEQSDRYTIG